VSLKQHYGVLLLLNYSGGIMRRRHIRSGRFSWLALIPFALAFCTGVSAQQTPPPPTPPKPEIEFAITNDGRRIHIPDVIGITPPVWQNGAWVWATPSSPGKDKPPKSLGGTQPSQTVGGIRPTEPSGAEPQVIIGDDNRSRSCCTNTFPYSAVAHITTSFAGVTESCTGAFYNNGNRQYIVTAGHCLYNGQWSGTAIITPGQNGPSNQAPFGTCGVGSFSVPDRWYYNQDGAFDIGVILMPPGGCFVNYTGYFGIQMANSSFNYQGTWMMGYHQDKDNGQTQWFDYATVYKSLIENS
jgi:V8-like Glu-specific endopeptidase